MGALRNLARGVMRFANRVTGGRAGQALNRLTRGRAAAISGYNAAPAQTNRQIANQGAGARH